MDEGLPRGRTSVPLFAFCDIAFGAKNGKESDKMAYSWAYYLLEAYIRGGEGLQRMATHFLLID